MVSAGLTCVTERSTRLVHPTDDSCALRLAMSSVAPVVPSNNADERLSSCTGAIADCASACVVDFDCERTPPGDVMGRPVPPVPPQPASRNAAQSAVTNLVRMIRKGPFDWESRANARPLACAYNTRTAAMTHEQAMNQT